MAAVSRLRLLFDDGGFIDGVELREALVEISVAVAANAALIGTVAVRSAFAVAGVELLDDVHALSHLAERREAHAVEAGVVTEVDEELSGAGVGAGGGEGDGAFEIALDHLVVLDVVGGDGDGGVGVGCEAELNDEAGQDAEELGVVKIAGADEGEEALDA